MGNTALKCKDALCAYKITSNMLLHVDIASKLKTFLLHYHCGLARMLTVFKFYFTLTVLGQSCYNRHCHILHTTFHSNQQFCSGCCFLLLLGVEEVEQLTASQKSI